MAGNEICVCCCCCCYRQAFARLSAVYGGTYMLHKSDAQVVFDEAGKAVGVSSEGETAKCKFVVGDASYFPGKSRMTSRVVRALCVLSHPIPNTDDAHSAQIILPQKQIGRRSGEAGKPWVACSAVGRRVCSSTPRRLAPC
jgi:RAB protein geranylgeranyltransferase component A